MNKRGWFTGVLLALVLLVIFGLIRSCVVADKTALGPVDDDYDSREWVGVVESTEIDNGDQLIVNVGFGGGFPRHIRLAHTKVLGCGPDPSTSASAALARLTTLLPAGTAVRIVRIGSRIRNLDSTQGYIYTTPTGATPTTGAETRTTSPSTTTTATTTYSPATSSATSSSTSVPTEEQPAAPEPGSINETLLADGYVSMDDPYIDLSAAASLSSWDQSILDYDLATVDRDLDRPMFERLLSANRKAWDASIGSQAECRADDQVRLDQKARDDEVARQRIDREQASLSESRAQRAQYDALVAGPDGIAGTDDDNSVTYDFDTKQYVIDDGAADAGSAGSSGGNGSFGGGGGSCRRWWC